MKWWGTDLGKTVILTPAVFALGLGAVFAWDALDGGEENAATTACERAVEDRGGRDLERPAVSETSDDLWSVRGVAATGSYWCEVSTADGGPVVLTVRAG